MKWFDRKFDLGVPRHLFGNLVERLRGAPLRLDERVAAAGGDLTRAPDGRWSIHGEAGHLVDLEPLWYGRVEDLLEGVEVMRPADLENRKTHDADHDGTPIQAILEAFRTERRALVARLEALSEDELACTALHPRLKQPMSFMDLCFFVAEHDDHHLARITELGRMDAASYAPDDGHWWIEPVVLEGTHVRLEPLAPHHIDDLWAIADHESIWRWMPMSVTRREDVFGMVDRALAWPRREWGQAFVQIHRESGKVVGATSYLNADAHNRRVEIGWTWIEPAHQRSPINSEAKLLLLRHAFETLGANRVEFKTDSDNTPSRNAIVRVGGVEEGTLRNHMVRRDGTMRHSVYFSVTAQEWPGVETRLLERMGSYGTRLPTR